MTTCAAVGQGCPAVASATVVLVAVQLAALCSLQPHPLRFVWSFLVAGLIRCGTSLALASRNHHGAAREVFKLVAEVSLADLVSFHMYAAAVTSGLSTVGGVVFAWYRFLPLYGAAGHALRTAVSVLVGGGIAITEPSS